MIYKKAIFSCGGTILFNRDYFKGWYFKCSTKEKTIAFIPAFHRHNHKETVSLQIITNDETYNILFDSLKYEDKPLCIKLGSCIFSEKGIELNVKNDNISIKGKLVFKQITPIKYNIMGPFKFVPFMQCRHSVYSMFHQIDGEIIINKQKFNFKNDIGYIEGDCGYSFPKQYIWTQCNFKNGSLMLSVADIPLWGIHFTGIIGIIMLNGKEHRFATYLGAKLKHIGDNTVTVKQGDYQITAKLIKKNAKPLYAPVKGAMKRTIYESASCKAYYCFSYKDKTLSRFTSEMASFEFEYI